MLMCLRIPDARGSVTLHSLNPYDHPKVDLNLFGEPRDLEVQLKCLKLLRKVDSMPGMDPIRGKELQPGPDLKTDDELKNAILEQSSFCFHGYGSCAIGNNITADPFSVVDWRLRVHGIS